MTLIDWLIAGEVVLLFLTVLLYLLIFRVVRPDHLWLMRLAANDVEFLGERIDGMFAQIEKQQERISTLENQMEHVEFKVARLKRPVES